MSKVLSILIIGGEASAGNCLDEGFIRGNRSYVPQLVSRLQRIGWQVQIECHAPIDIDVALPLLHRLNLNRFDLILLELGHTRLQEPAVFSDLFRASMSQHTGSFESIAARCTQNGASLQPVETGLIHTFMSYGKRALLQALALVRRLGRLREVDAQLNNLMYYLQPYRRRLLLMTPFPHPDPVSNWLRMAGMRMFRQHGRKNMIPAFDTSMVIRLGDEFFVDPQRGGLSPVACDLLGQTLYDYIQTNALLPTHPELRQRRGY